MKPQYLLGVDIGTYGSKGVLVDPAGRVLASSFAEHGVESPKPGWFEQDADAVWWQDLTRITRDLLARSGADPHAIAKRGGRCDPRSCIPMGVPQTN
jgi:xylulokinase